LRQGGNDHEEGVLSGGVQIDCGRSGGKGLRGISCAGASVFGGRFLTRSTSQVEAHEAELQLRTVGVELNRNDTALAARNSEAYQMALRALGSGSERDFCIVEGV
jgi:uncharacterized protein (DUF1330 family)